MKITFALSVLLHGINNLYSGFNTMGKASDIQFLSDALLKTRKREPKAKEHRPSVDIERPKTLHIDKGGSNSTWRAIFFSLLLTFTMVTMNATSKLAMKFSSHPQQSGMYKTTLFTIMTFASLVPTFPWQYI